MARKSATGSPACSRCGSDNLSRDSSKASGFASHCRECRAAVRRGETLPDPPPHAPAQRPVEPSLDTIKQGEITREKLGNCEVITTVSRTVRTLAGLLKAAGLDAKTIDRDANTEWMVESHLVNKWDQGVVIDGQHRVVELYQVKATVRRRKAVPILFDVVKPLNITLKIPKRSERAPTDRMRRVLIVPDAQFGFARDHHGHMTPLHDRAAWACMVEVARAAKPNRVIFLGDMLDLPEWSDRFVHGPEFAQTTQPALVELSYSLAQVMQTLVPYGREAPTGDYISGNHEARMTRAMQSNLAAACELRPVDEPNGAAMLSVPRLLSLDKLGIRYIDNYPHGAVWLNDNLRVSHGELVRSGSGETARAIVRDARNSEISGHTHRLEQVSKTVHPRYGAVSYVAFSAGTLARIDGVVPAATTRVNWQQGFGIVDLAGTGNDMFWIQAVPIHKGRAIWNGHVYQGKFSMAALKAATPGWRWAA